MIRTLLSLGSIMVAVALVVSGTVAFFSDTESATNNVFAAGALDLLIDNDSYYNGNRCTNVGTEEVPEWQWVGQADYPVPGTPCETSFVPSNLDDGLLFFNFLDVKPDDEGEDTISIHVQNDAWVCMDLELTADDDNDCTEPENGVEGDACPLDDSEPDGDPFDGELASGIHFFWWADDGDNVYEEGEQAITDGVVSLANLDAVFPVALADSQHNVWGEALGTPVPANETVYIAKAWCLGDLTLDPVLAGEGDNPSVDPGVDCDGSLYGNEYQTDSASLDISFSAIQARNNGDYLCQEPDVQTANLTINKVVVGGPLAEGDFPLFINGDSVNNGESNIVPANTLLTVSETDNSGLYVSEISGDCNADGEVTLVEDQVAECTITNTYTPVTLTVDKILVITTGGVAASDFTLHITGPGIDMDVSDNVPVPDLPAGEYTVTETATGNAIPIPFTTVYSGACTDNGGASGSVTLTPGDNLKCVITNTEIE